MKKIFSKILYPFKFLNDSIYDLRVKLHAKKKPNKKVVELHSDRVRDAIFYGGFIAVPLAMFILINFVINANTFVLAFQKTEGQITSFNGFNNFIQVFKDFIYNNKDYQGMLWRSTIVYLVGVAIIPLTLLFSYYVYKKSFGHNVFKILLFLPTILSSIVSVAIFKTIANRVIPYIVLQITGNKINPLVTDPKSIFGTMLFYSIWMGFGSGLLTRLATMNSVDPSVSEAGQLDGVGFLGEFWHIVMPVSFPIIMLNFIITIPSIFTNTLNMYSFFGTGLSTKYSVIGYFIQTETLKDEFSGYHYLSAYNLTITAVTLPLVFGLKKLFEKYGPSEE